MTETGAPLITIRQALAAGACTDGVDRMRDRLREACPDATTAELDAIPFAIGDVALVSLSDALWCLRLLDDRRTIVRAIMPAVQRASVHTSDRRVHDCIAAVERWLDGGDGADLGHAAAEAWAAAAAEAAWAAAWSAAEAARAARSAAAAEAAWEAAWAAEAAVVRAARSAAAAEAAEAAVVVVRVAAGVVSTEHAAQVADLVALFPPVMAPKKEMNNEQ